MLGRALLFAGVISVATASTVLADCSFNQTLTPFDGPGNLVDFKVQPGNVVTVSNASNIVALINGSGIDVSANGSTIEIVSDTANEAGFVSVFARRLDRLPSASITVSCSADGSSDGAESGS